MCLSPENYAVCHILCDKCQSHSRLFCCPLYRYYCHYLVNTSVFCRFFFFFGLFFNPNTTLISGLISGFSFLFCYPYYSRTYQQ